MNLRVSVFYTAMILAGGAAHATRNPTPPPSGIVVHLFGPGSVTSNILPQVAPVAGPAGTAAAPAGQQPAAMPAAMPDMGDILHQMFVVGDPDAKPGQALAKGRGAERE